MGLQGLQRAIPESRHEERGWFKTRAALVYMVTPTAAAICTPVATCVAGKQQPLDASISRQPIPSQRR